jgi:rubrerythrin
MGERQQLQSNRKCYRTNRDVISDAPLLAVIERLIRETEDHLAQVGTLPEPALGELQS